MPRSVCLGPLIVVGIISNIRRTDSPRGVACPHYWPPGVLPIVSPRPSSVGQRSSNRACRALSSRALPQYRAMRDSWLRRESPCSPGRDSASARQLSLRLTSGPQLEATSCHSTVVLHLPPAVAAQASAVVGFQSAPSTGFPCPILPRSSSCRRHRPRGRKDGRNEPGQPFVGPRPENTRRLLAGGKRECVARRRLRHPFGDPS